MGVGRRAGRKDDPRTRQRRAALLRISAGIAEDPELLAECGEQIGPYLKDRRAVDADLAGSLVPIAARGGSAKLYTAYLQTSRKARTPQERIRFQLALADFRDPALFSRTLELLLQPEVRTQDVIALLRRLLLNPAARETTWNHVRERWSELGERIPPASTSSLVSDLTLLGSAHRAEVQAFFRAHPMPAAKRAVRQALERFALNAELLRRTRGELRSWLSARKGDAK